MAVTTPLSVLDISIALSAPVKKWHIEKMDGRKWCRHLTDFFQYMHGWKQGGIIISIYDISFLQFPFCKNTVYLKEWVATIALL